MIHNFTDEQSKRGTEPRFSHFSDVRILFAQMVAEQQQPFSLRASLNRKAAGGETSPAVPGEE